MDINVKIELTFLLIFSILLQWIFLKMYLQTVSVIQNKSEVKFICHILRIFQ